MTRAHAARGEEPGRQAVSEPWPQGISRQATMRISDVLAALEPEFGSISHSKLRFLEEQGLIDPVRTASGYRQYSQADLERLRFVLSEQRDSYLPLKVIKERLAAMDAGEPAPGPAPRLADAAGAAESSRRRWTADSLADATGTRREFVQQLVTAGVVRPGAGGLFDPGAADVVRIVARLAEYGIEPRHLRPLRTSAERHVGLVDQLVAPYRSQQTPSARARAANLSAEVGELLARLHTAWIRQGTADLA